MTKTEDFRRSPEPFRTALVGLGRIGYGYHGPAIRNHPGYRLVAAVDPLEERRREVAEAWSVPGYPTVDELFASTAVDLLVIASPTRFHAEQTRQAFAAGAHVLCDKPVATSLAELDVMLAAAEAAQRRFLAYQPARFGPEMQALRDLLERQLLGPLHYIRRSRNAYSRRRDWQSRRSEGGGMLNNWSPHCFDEVISLLPGQQYPRVFCETRSIATRGDAEDVVKATLVSSTGIIIDIDVSQACPLGGAPWEVRGQYGSALYDAAHRSWVVRYLPVDQTTGDRPLQSGLAAEARRYEDETLPWSDLTLSTASYVVPDYYEAAWHYFQTGQQAPVSPAESRLVVDLIDRCRRSAAQGS